MKTCKTLPFEKSVPKEGHSSQTNLSPQKSSKLIIEYAFRMLCSILTLSKVNMPYKVQCCAEGVTYTMSGKGKTLPQFKKVRERKGKRRCVSSNAAKCFKKS